VICRFGLLGLTKKRPIVSPPLPAREIDPRALEELAISPHVALNPSDFPSPSLSATSSSFSEEDPNHPYTLPRTGLTLPSLSSTTPTPFARTDGITSYLFSRVLTVEDIKPAAQLLPRLNGLSWYAEILHILRPLLYALIMQRWVRKRGEEHARRSWWPWLLGLSIEYAAMELRKRGDESGCGYRSGLGRLEKEEQKQRSKAMWWWALRGAMYENVSKYGR
jgi:peroxin-16